ncbi:rho guanine nucleotide exchange factor 3 isoform X1 [Boleophthalmus pectinirostris]|uniref:rho guanine nucleotide exchange factor 3 isoform X1 n=1 Tax=Boleophthalmus pectinirostris TaxID=150288 RepID=UPI0024311145|nr:rho guanine nucleotide exchange factor 3 isoform X1 [Boleophthalmus pectinirostris]
MQKNDDCPKRSRWKLQKRPSPSLQPEAASPVRGKKRKQESRDVDNLSLCSLDLNEPSTKRSKPVSRVTSLVNLLPPVKTAPLKRIGLSLQRSISLRTDSRNDHSPVSPSASAVKTRVVTATVSSPGSSATIPRVSTGTAASLSSGSKRRDSKLWSETIDVRLSQTLSPKEIKRQEAIFELVQGEQDLVEDLKLAKKAYHDPMRTLCIMTEQELNQIFGTLDSLIPLHEDLLNRLRDERKSDGCTEHVGHILTQWVPCLSEYTPYCSNQVKAKALLDQKKQESRVHDFLQRCLLSPFSRKLELWSFLDIPRSRLVKYPLLLREILRHTDNEHPDRQRLEEAMAMVQSVVADINRQTGESECEFYKERLVYTEEGHRHELIERSRTLSCHGELKNHRGVKLHVFLFQDVLVITRSVSSSEQPIRYQLCRQPIPIEHLELEDLSDGEMRVGGSIRGAFSNNERTKNFFRVSSKVGGQSHCFQASDAFNKQQWINCIRQAKATPPSTSAPPPSTTIPPPSTSALPPSITTPPPGLAQDEPGDQGLDRTLPDITHVNGQDLEKEHAKEMEVEEDIGVELDRTSVTEERLAENGEEEKSSVEISTDEQNKMMENRDVNRAEMDSIQETEEAMQVES